MSRPLRIELPGALFHFTSCGAGRDPIYLDDADRPQWLTLFGQVEEAWVKQRQGSSLERQRGRGQVLHCQIDRELTLEACVSLFMAEAVMEGAVERVRPKMMTVVARSWPACCPSCGGQAPAPK